MKKTLEIITWLIFWLVMATLFGFAGQYGKGIHMGLYPEEYRVEVNNISYDGEEIPLFLTPDYRCEEIAYECSQCKEITGSYCPNECVYLASDYCLEYGESKGYMGLMEYMKKNMPVTDAVSSELN